LDPEGMGPRHNKLISRPTGSTTIDETRRTSSAAPLPLRRCCCKSAPVSVHRRRFGLPQPFPQAATAPKKEIAQQRALGAA